MNAEIEVTVPFCGAWYREAKTELDIVVPTVAPWTAYPKVLGGAAGVTVTVAEALWLGSAWLVAVTVTVVLALTVGAVKSPELETDPAAADQVTAVFVVPVTVAVNCWVAPEATVAVVGEMLTALDGPHVPAVRLLLKPFKMLPKPMFVLVSDEMAEPSPVPAPKLLLLRQPFAVGLDIPTPGPPGPLIITSWTYGLSLERLITALPPVFTPAPMVPPLIVVWESANCATPYW
jgi:hypothetical protein